MALVYVDGFDAGDWRTRYSLTNGEPTGVGTVASTRTGEGLAWRATTTNSTPTGLMRLIPASDYVVFGLAVKAGLPFNSSYPNRIMALGNSSGMQVTVNIPSTSTPMQVFVGSTLVFPIPASMDAWNYIELKLRVHPTAGFLEARLNGVVVSSFTGDTQNAGALTTIDRVYIGSYAGGNSDQSDNLWDDVYVSTGTTAEEAEYLGEIRVKSLKVNGPGTHTGLTPTGSATNWENVDEFPPSDTDYNSSDVTGAKDTYSTENLALTPGDRIIGVQANAIVSTVEAGTGSAKLVFRSGTTEYTSAPVNVTSTGVAVSAIYPKNPVTSSDWTESTVNDTEIGLEVG